MEDKAYVINKHPRQQTLKKAMQIVAGGVDLFNPTEEGAIAVCISSLYKKCFEANKKYRKGQSSGYTDAEYDAMERSLMVYCSDFESLK